MVIITVVKCPHCYPASLIMKDSQWGKNQSEPVGTILVNIPISLLPTPSRIFPIRWAHSWALKQSLINITNYESTVKISYKKHRATWKNLLVDWRNLSVNAWIAKRITKVDAFTVITKLNRWILMQIDKCNWSNW